MHDPSRQRWKSKEGNIKGNVVLHIHMRVVRH